MTLHYAWQEYKTRILVIQFLFTIDFNFKWFYVIKKCAQFYIDKKYFEIGIQHYKKFVLNKKFMIIRPYK